jgi:hypothetical protein
MAGFVNLKNISISTIPLSTWYIFEAAVNSNIAGTVDLFARVYPDGGTVPAWQTYTDTNSTKITTPGWFGIGTGYDNGTVVDFDTLTTISDRTINVAVSGILGQAAAVAEFSTQVYATGIQGTLSSLINTGHIVACEGILGETDTFIRNDAINVSSKGILGKAFVLTGSAAIPQGLLGQVSATIMPEYHVSISSKGLTGSVEARFGSAIRVSGFTGVVQADISSNNVLYFTQRGMVGTVSADIKSSTATRLTAIGVVGQVTAVINNGLNVNVSSSGLNGRVSAFIIDLTPITVNISGILGRTSASIIPDIVSNFDDITGTIGTVSAKISNGDFEDYVMRYIR